MPFGLRKALYALQLEVDSRPGSQTNLSHPRRHNYHRHSRMLRLLPDDDLDIIEQPARRRDYGDIIVISDDDDDDGDDEENRPPYVPRRKTRPLSTGSLRSDSPLFSDENETELPDRSHHVSKRRKTERDSSRAAAKSRKTPLTGHETGYTKANLSFTPKGSRASLHFQTGNAVRSSLPKPSRLHQNDFVQGFLDDPFDINNSPPPEMRACPYYDDQDLSSRMYRGPGYERFPVVLGTVKGHKAICDKWDADKTNEHEEDMLYIASLSGGVNPFSITKTQTAARLERQCLREVQDIFPKIQTKFVLEKYRAHAANSLDDGLFPSSMEIVSEIAELNTYPREASADQEDEVLVLPEDGTGITIVYDKNKIKNEAYRKEALRLLAGHFTHIPTIAINRALEQKQSLFDTFTHLSECEATYFEMPQARKPYTRSRQPRVNLEKKYQRGFDEPNTSHLYQTLVNELQAAKQQAAREAYRLKKNRDTEAAEEQNLQRHKLEGSLIECQTCFDDEVPMNRALMCEDNPGHFFCFGCVSRLAESQIGAMKHEMNCMDGSGCKAMLPTDGVSRAVPTKVVNKLAFYQQQAEISAAGIEGLEQCPHCEYKGICDPIEEDSVFNCQNLDCGKNTCRKCNEASHLPKNCEEAKKDKGLSARHLVEEARSEAMMRKCPKCKARIIKELGCNKMVCSCGNQMCYVCQADISGQHKDAGYQHFHKAGSKCALYDAQGLERHDQDADAAEKEAIAKVKAQEGNEDLDAKELEIETGAGKPKKKPKPQLPGLHAFPYGNFAGVPPYAPGLLAGLPLLQADPRIPPQHHHRRHLALQEQLEDLRVRGEMLQRRREALEDGRIDNVYRAAQDAQREACEAQERMDRIVGARHGQNEPAFGLLRPPPPRPMVARPGQGPLRDGDGGEYERFRQGMRAAANRGQNVPPGYEEIINNMEFEDYVFGRQGGARH